MVSIIDDDESVRAATRCLVRSLGYATRTFASAEEFLGSPYVAETSCVIADVQMRKLSGLDLQNRLRAEGYDTPIIFITAFPEERIKTRRAERRSGVLSQQALRWASDDRLPRDGLGRRKATDGAKLGPKPRPIVTDQSMSRPNQSDCHTNLCRMEFHAPGFSMFHVSRQRIDEPGRLKVKAMLTNALSGTTPQFDGHLPHPSQRALLLRTHRRASVPEIKAPALRHAQPRSDVETALPLVAITPANHVKRRVANWSGMTAEIVQATSSGAYRVSLRRTSAPAGAVRAWRAPRRRNVR